MAGFLFWLFGAIAVICAILCVTRRNPVYGAFFLLLTLGSVAVEFLLMHSPFIAAMQIILYAGAIVVLFVFVIMLLSLKAEELGEEPPMTTKAGAAVLASCIFVLLSLPVFSGQSFAGKTTEDGKFIELNEPVKLKTIFKVVAMRRGLSVEDVKNIKIQEGPIGNAAPGAQEFSPAERKRNRARYDVMYLASVLCVDDKGEWTPGVRDELVLSMGLTDHDAIDNGIEEVEQSMKSVEDGKGSKARNGLESAAARKTVLDSMKRKIKVRSARYGSLEHFVDFLYSRYIVAFELVSILIFAAIAGVLVLARRKGFMGLETDGEERRGGMYL
ncbi:MAG: NADH-quinone oxidoreductase subunit J [Planctomycetota bacterium]|nr:NADH-quinone oxidoreductase subunit J [Planctomycetota bacterium]